MTQIKLRKSAPVWRGNAVVNGEVVEKSLTEYAGTYLVFFFYPVDFTFQCLTEILAFNEKAEEFKAMNCDIVACSTDSHFSHLAWVSTTREKGGLGSVHVTLLADKNREISRQYDVLKEDESVTSRGLFIIDDKSILRHITISDLPIDQSVDETLRLVQALQFRDKHGEGCADGIKSGTSVIKPVPKGSGESPLPRKTRFFVYLSHTLSSWGDRMWAFGVGLFMIIISPDSLRLTAIYGLSGSCAILLLGALVGDWIDRTPRLKAARTTLVIQNMSVLICALCIFVVITFKSQIDTYWPNQGLLILCYAGIIVIAVMSNLASMGTKIALQRDWIVEICGRDKDALASMSAIMRAIDLVTLTVAPILTGQIMTYASTRTGALFIGGWNLVSVFVEYYLLWKVYDIVPALKAKRYKRRADKEPFELDTEQTPMELKTIDPNDRSLANDVEATATKDATAEIIKVQGEDDTSSPIDKEIRRRSSDVQKEMGDCSACLKKTFSGLFILVRGWKTYMKYSVAYAGIGLAFLYMTVLGFDNITVGYSYSQGITESIMGILMAAGGLSGIFGAFLYPKFRRRLGIERTGLFGFFLEVSFLCLCVASVWAPGSPFDPLFRNQMQESVPYRNDTLHINITTFTNLTQTNVTTFPHDKSESSTSVTNISVWLLMAGIVGARCGLWIADLTITQLFLENVEETQRGIVNGVQTSLNQLMDILKCIMVIVAPKPETFGILILISFGFILLGWLFYAKYSHKTRGHLFHFDKIRKCECGDAQNNNVSADNMEV